MKLSVGALFLLAVSALVGGCSESAVCTPNATTTCPCGGGVTGTQSCNAMGTGFVAACACGSDAGADVVRTDVSNVDVVRTDVPNCTSECSNGASQCVGNGYQACSRGADGCFHWSTTVPCTGSDTCQGGACIPAACHPVCDNMLCGATHQDGCTPPHPCGCPTGMVCTTTDTCCTPENGAAYCSTVMDAWCARVAMCCAAMPAGACMSWAYTVPLCRGHYTANGFDCSSSTWTSQSICMESATHCANDIPLVACSDIAAGTANLPASCN